MRRFSVLPAISLVDGILHCDIVEGSFCTATFMRFIEKLLDRMEPYPAPNSVIVMDNCQIHKHPDIQAMIEERYDVICQIFYITWQTNKCRGMRCEFLPPYSPDFNPIELAFSVMKYHLRRDGHYTRLAMELLTDEEIYLCLLRS